MSERQPASKLDATVCDGLGGLTSLAQEKDRPVRLRSQSLPASTVLGHPPLSLPTPVPCTGAPPTTAGTSSHQPANSRVPLTFTTSLPTPWPVSVRYPHLSLPPNAPPYLFTDKIFTPCAALLAQLMDMGVTERAATKALYWTGNSCIERASNWVFERPEESLKTPLESEIKMLRADLDMKEEEMRERIRILSSDSGVHLVEGDLEFHAWEMEEWERVSDISEDFEIYKLVLVINKSHQLSPGQMTAVVGKATANMLAKVAMSEFGDEQLDMWDACSQQVVVMEGENTRHLLDLRLAAECLQLEWGEEGEVWDRANMRYRETMVLGIWGEENDVHNVVGRLGEVV